MYVVGCDVCVCGGDVGDVCLVLLVFIDGFGDGVFEEFWCSI